MSDPRNQPYGRRPMRWLGAGLALALPMALLVVHARRYMPFIADDALISLRYARRWLDGHGLTWTDGAPVEGYTNFLWIVGSAGLNLLGVDLIDSVRVLGFTCCALMCVAAIRLFARPAGGDSSPSSHQFGAGLVGALFAGLALASSGPVAVWAIGGLEATLIGAALAWALVLIRPALLDADTPTRSALIAGIPLALACLTRTDSPLFVALLSAVVLGVHRARRDGWRLAFAVALVPAAATLGQVAFRLAYYGELLPNPAKLKARWTAERLDGGLEYVGDGLLAVWPLLIVAAFALWAALRGHRRRVTLVLLVWLSCWMAYVASVGGDIFPARRHMLVVAVGLALLGGIGVEWVILKVVARLRDRPLAWAAWLPAPALAGLALSTLWSMQAEDRSNRRAIHERWEWDGAVIGRLYRDHFPVQPYIAVTAAGTLPYFSGLRALDMQGLNDAHIASQPPMPGFFLGHDHGDGPYVLAQQPDLMVFGGAKGGDLKFAAGAQLKPLPEFHRDYDRAKFVGFEPHLTGSEPYIRLDGPLGITRGEGRISIPAYLFKRTVGQPGAPRQMLARLRPHASLRSPGIHLPAGTWRVELEPASAQAGLSVRVPGARAVPSPRGDTLVVARDATAHMALMTGPIEALVERVTFTRVAEPPPDGVDKPMMLRTIRKRPSATPNASTLERRLGGFEAGLDGWQAEGEAFGWASADARRPSRLDGTVGGYVSSYDAQRRDRLVGTLRSPAFTIPSGGVLSLRVAGGDHRVGVRLWVAGRVVMVWHGADDSTLRTHLLDLTPFVGQEATIEAYDSWQRGWGHIVVDSVELHRLEPTR